MLSSILNKKVMNLNKDLNKNKFFTTMFIFIQIQLLMESAPKGSRWSKEWVVLLTFMLSLISFIYFCIYKKRKIKKKSILFINLIIIISLLSMEINQDFIGDNFVFIIVITSSFFICNAFTKDEYLEGYVNAMIIYSVYSLFATYFILPIIMKGNLNIFNTYINSIGTPVVDLGFSFAIKWNGFMRNQGIFREPGVYQFFLLVALSIEMFYKISSNNKKVIILIVTLVTTFSTVGLICLPIILVLFIFSKKNKSSLKTLGFIILTLVTIYFIIQGNEELKNIIERTFSKLNEGNENESFVVRFESIINLIKMSAHNVIVGNSFVNGFNYIQNNYNTFNTNDITGTMLSYIMALGYPIGIWININFYKFCYSLNKNRIISFCIFILLFISLNTQNLVYNSIVGVFILIPYMKKSDKVELKYAE